MSSYQMLTYRFKYANPILKLIYINAAVFAISLLVNLVSFLFFKEKGIANLYLSLPSNLHLLVKQFWSVLTYQFAHHGVFHFVFNMITLYFIGSIFLDFYKKIEVYKVYLLGGLSAAVLFYISMNLLPVFKGQSHLLIGASGSVMAIMFASAVYAPHIQLKLFGIFNVKLIWIALAYVVIDLFTISESAYSGGNIAHIGGALFGVLYAYYKKGILQFRLFQSLININKTKMVKPKVKVTYQRETNVNRNTVNKTHNITHPSQDVVDAILDKISKTGYDKLSKEEKDILFKASQD